MWQSEWQAAVHPRGQAAAHHTARPPAGAHLARDALEHGKGGVGDVHAVPEVVVGDVVVAALHLGWGWCGGAGVGRWGGGGEVAQGWRGGAGAGVERWGRGGEAGSEWEVGAEVGGGAGHRAAREARRWQRLAGVSSRCVTRHWVAQWGAAPAALFGPLCCRQLPPPAALNWRLSFEPPVVRPLELPSLCAVLPSLAQPSLALPSLEQPSFLTSSTKAQRVRTSMKPSCSSSPIRSRSGPLQRGERQGQP